jgi:hypothetical protein
MATVAVGVADVEQHGLAGSKEQDQSAVSTITQRAGRGVSSQRPWELPAMRGPLRGVSLPPSLET